MGASNRREREATALVLGSDAVGSAVAHGLHSAGWDVVLIDDIDPPWPWRGMSFVNAWYFGGAELAGVAACFCASVKSVPSVMHRQNLIAATSWSWHGVAALLLPEVLVDTRSADGGAIENLLARAPHGLLTVGCGPGYAAGEEVTLAIDCSFGPRAGMVVRSGTTSFEVGARPPIGGAAQERLVIAPRSGRMRTQYRIGDRVAAGEPIGDVNGALLMAPMDGVLRGLSARGARLASGRVVADVDPRGDAALCYGLDERAARIAAGVTGALCALGPGGGAQVPLQRAGPLQWR